MKYQKGDLVVWDDTEEPYSHGAGGIIRQFTDIERVNFFWGSNTYIEYGDRWLTQIVGVNKFKNVYRFRYLERMIFGGRGQIVDEDKTYELAADKFELLTSLKPFKYKKADIVYWRSKPPGDQLRNTMLIMDILEQYPYCLKHERSRCYLYKDLDTGEKRKMREYRFEQLTEMIG